MKQALLLGEISAAIYSEYSASGKVEDEGLAKLGGGKSRVRPSACGTISVKDQVEARFTNGPEVDWLAKTYEVDYPYAGNWSQWLPEDFRSYLNSIYSPYFPNTSLLERLDRPVLQFFLDVYKAKVVTRNATIAELELRGNDNINATVGSLGPSSTSISLSVINGTFVAHSHSYPHEKEDVTYASLISLANVTSIRSEAGGSSDDMLYNGYSVLLAYAKYHRGATGTLVKGPDVAYYDIVYPERLIRFPYYRGPENDPYGLLSEHFRIDRVPWGIGYVYGYDP